MVGLDAIMPNKVEQLKSKTALLIMKMRETIRVKTDGLNNIDENLEMIQRDVIPYMHLLDEAERLTVQVMIYEDIRLLIQPSKNTRLHLNKIDAEIELLKKNHRYP